MRPAADRLFGRKGGHRLRPRQTRLLAETLPRLRFDPDAGFPGRDALWLEIGFGGGEHALAQMAAHPDTGVVACEVFQNGICSLLSRLVPDGGEASAPLPANLRLWDDDARLLLRRLPDAALDRVFLLFPDPWPKARHARRRFVHPDNVALLGRVLRPGGLWRVASDDPTYQDWVREVMAAQTLFTGPAPVGERPEGWPPTRYEAKALRAGRTPMYWEFCRTG